VINDLKPYPEMKDTGLPWVGQIPSNWGLVPNRELIRKRKLLVGDRHADFRLLSLTKAGIIVRDISTGRGKFSADMGTSQEVREGDLVFCLFDVPETPRTVGLSKHHGMITGAYTVFECKDNQLARFLEAFYIAMDDRKLLSPLYSGLRNTIPPPVLLGQKTPLPPAPEQAAIVRFLDHADRKIRRYIRAKQKLIKLLEEQKQAIINRAVTHGLDPSVPLKPSGIPWLGEIPAHWELSPNRAFLRIRKDLVGDRHTEFTLLSLTKRGFIVRDLSGMRGKFSSDMGTSQEVRPGDLVLCLFDVPETPRTVGLSHHAGMITGAYTVLESRSADIAAFLELFYIAMDDRKLLSPLYSGLRNTIPTERFLGAKTPIPPEDERAEILIAVKERTASLNTAISRLEREIDLLREYRTRLIADVVTGKLDVRESTAQLPDEDQELPPIDESDEISDAEEDGFDDLDEGSEDPEP